MVSSKSLTQHPLPLASDTSETCWLCDRERGELCHVHEQVERGYERDDPEVVWVVAPTEAD